jgi:hypothetical protein
MRFRKTFDIVSVDEKNLFGDLKPTHRKFWAFEVTQVAQKSGNWKLD